MFRKAGNSAFDFAGSLTDALPALAEFGKSVYSVFASIFNGIKGFASGTLDILTGLFSVAAKVGISGAASAAMGLAGSAVALHNAKDMDPNAMNGFFDKMSAASPALSKNVADSKARFDKGFEDHAGSLRQRGADYDHLLRAGGGPQKVEVYIKADLTTHPDKDSHTRFEARVQGQVMKGLIRGQQRASN